ncbi:MAG: outer membrane lipid asymmetry maintenance protein MlaD [Alphaproteobacteria bacterium]|nr:outer membrane lipid asymmetry maintenance protein MlaD [Alphaproteobacteria bacterium]
MNRSLIETVMGAVVLAVAVIFVLFVYEKRNMSGGDGLDLVASFDNVSGISTGSDVRIGGIKVGTITNMVLNPDTYRANVSMRFSSNVAIPDDSSASIVSEGLLGGKFIQVVPGADDRMLEAGSEIRYTQSSVNLEEMIGKFMFSGGGVDSAEELEEGPAPSLTPGGGTFLD